MARITVEDCLTKVENRFELVQLVSKRAKQLRSGSEAVVRCKNKEIVTALREVAAGKIEHVHPPEYGSDEF
ncbi:MAG: DNA-directed RNA polymerase subunit omega [Bacteriovoracaceae bacterium]|nr:DNA-directed RNA polymerase subunit omega [Bacteriovoracaceae bacterium]